MATQETIERAGQLLARAAGRPAKVILFGSHARGEARPGSDLDFLVIEREVTNHHSEMVRLQRALLSIGAPADVLVASQEQIDEWGDVKGTVLHRALAEGRILHG